MNKLCTYVQLFLKITKNITLDGDSGEEVALWRLTLFSRWSKAKFKSPCNFGRVALCHRPHIFSTCHLWKCRYRARVYWNLSYTLSILKVIFLESNPLRFIEILLSFIRGFVYCLYIVYARLKIKLFVFVFHKQTTMAPFW